MEDKQLNLQNKDLILRERLAIERTTMANDTTLLAFIRTALYFYVAGLSINQLLRVQYGLILEVGFGAGPKKMELIPPMVQQAGQQMELTDPCHAFHSITIICMLLPKTK